MNSWTDSFYFFIFGVTLLMSIMGLWFTAIIPGIDRWSKRFFMSYFFIFILCCIASLMETFVFFHPVPAAALYSILIFECLVLSMPMAMLTVYLLHCCGEDLRSARLMRAVLGLLIVYLILIVASPFAGIFSRITADSLYYRGPLYPLLIMPLIAIMVLNLAGAVRRRPRLSRKVFLGFLIAIVPMTVALIIQMFVDVYWLIDIGFVLSGLSMYGLVLSSQIEQDLRNQREIARQQQEIAQERASVMVLQMRPHFIYNTLMSIYSLCNIDPQKARQVTLDFTNYLRKNFNAVASDSTIPFSAELEHTRAYLAVEQAQFEDMLLVEYDTQFVNFRLPPLTLQPIVENAVKHGMDPYSGPLHISVRTRYTDPGIEIIVEDDGPGFDPSDESNPNAALTNIRQRLDMMCRGKLDVASRDGGGTKVTITIPDRNA